jgi:hypothetical protein
MGLPTPAVALEVPIVPIADAPIARSSHTGLVLLGLVVGLIVIAYAFVTANR